MTAAEPTPTILLDDLHYTVGGRYVLGGVNLTIRPAELVAIVGGSGSGKTTLLRLIMGLIRPTGGRLLVRGVDITGLRENELNEIRKTVGLVFQYSALFDFLSVAENVAFGLRQHRRLEEAAIQAAVAEKLALVGMEGTEQMRPAELSGGMRKRVGIARALALEPDIMLYDEPTSGLDPPLAAAVDDLIVQLRDRLGVTSVVVSHDVATVLRTADRMAMLHQGRIIEEGPPRQLAERGGPVVRQFLGRRGQAPG